MPSFLLSLKISINIFWALTRYKVSSATGSRRREGGVWWALRDRKGGEVILEKGEVASGAMKTFVFVTIPVVN